MNIKRIIAIILACIFLLAATTACTDDGNEYDVDDFPPGDSEDTYEYEEEQYEGAEDQYFEQNGNQYYRCAGCGGGYGVHLTPEFVDGKLYCSVCAAKLLNKRLLF